MSVSFNVIGSYVAFTLKFIDKVCLQGFRNTLFTSKIITESLACLKNVLNLQSFKCLPLSVFFRDTRNTP